MSSVIVAIWFSTLTPSYLEPVIINRVEPGELSSWLMDLSVLRLCLSHDVMWQYWCCLLSSLPSFPSPSFLLFHLFLSPFFPPSLPVCLSFSLLLCPIFVGKLMLGQSGLTTVGLLADLCWGLSHSAPVLEEWGATWPQLFISISSPPLYCGHRILWQRRLYFCLEFELENGHHGFCLMEMRGNKALEAVELALWPVSCGSNDISSICPWFWAQNLILGC